MMTQIATAFGAGFLASLSPCIYPMLPITLGFLTKQASNVSQTDFKKRLKVIAFFCGQVFSFTTLGVLAVQIGEIFGFSSQSRTVNFAVSGLLFIMAMISISEKAQGIFAKMNSLLPQGSSKGTPSFLSAFLFGATSAVVASPCTSPVLGGVLSQISSRGEFVAGVVQMFAFSLGMGLIFLILGLGLLNMKKMPRAGQWMNTVHRLTAILLFVASGYYLWMGIR